MDEKQNFEGKNDGFEDLTRIGWTLASVGNENFFVHPKDQKNSSKDKNVHNRHCARKGETNEKQLHDILKFVA